MPPSIDKPTDAQTLAALKVVGAALDIWSSRVIEGVYYFVVDDSWALSLSPDYAGRFRVGALYGRTEVATLWSLSTDMGRLADLARAFKAEVEALER